MTWVITIILMLLGAFTGFVLGVAYGQEHPDE